MLRWSVKTQPKVEPLTLVEARAHLREPEASEDGRVAACLTAARQHVENICERALMPQVWVLRADRFCEVVKLPGGTVRQIVSIKYFDTAGVEATMPEQDYQLDAFSSPARLAPGPGLSWPSVQEERLNAVVVEYSCGYDDSSAVPGAIKSAILLLMADLFENREAQVVGATLVSNRAVESLLWPYKLRVLV